MHLFSASSLFTEENIKSISAIANDREKTDGKNHFFKKTPINRTYRNSAYGSFAFSMEIGINDI